MRRVIMLVALAVLNIQVQAASIGWMLEEMPNGISDDIVRVDGVYKIALNAGAPASDTTVNGVSFIKAPGGTSGSASSNGITIAYSAPGGYANDTGGDALPDPGRYEPQLENVMLPMLSSGYEGDITVTISALSTGKPYHVQFLIDQSSAGNRGMQILQGSVNSGDFAVGTSGHGESVVADFTADTNTMVFTIHPTGGGGRAVLNGVTVFEAIPTEIIWTLEDMNTNQVDTIVRNNGKYKVAVNLGTSSDASVNNVLFKQSAGGISGSVESNGVAIYYNVDGGYSSDVGGDGDNRYVPQLENVMLPMLSTAYSAGQIDIIVSGLQVGFSYRVQFLHDQSSSASRNMCIAQGNNISETFSVGTSGHGTSVIAGFVATESYVKFSVLRVGGGQRAVLNGVAVSRIIKGTVVTIK